MTAEYTSEHLEDSWRTLGICQARHIASLRVSVNDNSATHEELSNFRKLLSPREIELSREGIVLPPPERMKFSARWVSPDLWNIRVEQEIVEKGNIVYIITGCFDVFTMGHESLIYFADLLAKSHSPEARQKILELQLKFGLPEDDFLTKILSEGKSRGGVVAARLESDDYIRQFKGHEPIFTIDYRLGWFNSLPVKWITDFPTSKYASKSWGFGNELLTGWPESVNIRESLVFVLPENPKNKKESRSLDKREAQLRDFGFGVVRVPSHLEDVSSSKLIKRFNLKPVRGI